MSSLAGMGKVGVWQVDIDEESESTALPWSVTITYPRFYCHAGFQSLDILLNLVGFLTAKDIAVSQYRVPLGDGAVIEVARTEDAFSIKVLGAEPSPEKRVRWMVACDFLSSEAVDLAGALREAVEEVR